MSRRRADGRKRGFWATWTLPLVGGPLITLACGIALLMTFGEGPGPGATAGNFGLRASTEVPASAAEARMETVAAVSRNVTPPGVTPGPLVEGPLKRIEPPKPVTVERGEPTDTFRRIVVLDGGHFRVVHKGQALVVRLAGIKSPAFDETCRDSAGVEWKCGSKARAELARLIGGGASSAASWRPPTRRPLPPGARSARAISPPGWWRTAGLTPRPRTRC